MCNFHDFQNKYHDSLFEFDVNIIEKIISNDQLKLYNEEELFDIVLELYLKSKEYSTLFSHVNFINLSTKSLLEFCQKFDINDINISIWKNICFRLEQDISDKSKETFQKLNQNRYIGTRHEQIIQHLKEKYQENNHAQSAFCITSSSELNNNCKVGNIVEQDVDNFFESLNEANQWIQFDFKERKVLLDSYTLKTINFDQTYEHLKNWILEISNDGKNYEEIDHHENCDCIYGPLKEATFNVSCSTPQRFVRLSQIGPNWRGNDYLALNQMEFSGILYE